MNLSEKFKHYEKCFENTKVPADLRSAAVMICEAYGIQGICDPVYIANTIAMNIGRGDGHSKFTSVDESWVCFKEQQHSRLGSCIYCGYSNR